MVVPTPRRFRGWWGAALAIPLLCLTGCTAVVSLDPAPSAVAVACAGVVARLPDTVDSQQRRNTDAQGTGAWGNPASVLLRCGVATPGPTTERCVSVDGVDWIIDESQAAHNQYIFTTFGRTPAVAVVIDSAKVSGTTAITDLSSAVGSIPASGGCTNPTGF